MRDIVITECLHGNVGNPASVRMKITQNMTGENVTIFVSQLGLGDNRVKTEINMSAGYIYASIPNPAHSRLVLGFTIRRLYIRRCTCNRERSNRS